MCMHASDASDIRIEYLERDFQISEHHLLRHRYLDYGLDYLFG